MRRWNLANLDAYCSALDARRLPPANSVASTSDESGAERTILRLRTARGVEADEIRHELPWALSNRLVEPVDGGRLRLTVKGRLLSNELFARLVVTPKPPTVEAA